MSLSTRAFIASVCQMLTVAILVAGVSATFIGPWIFGTLVAVAIQLFLFPFSMKNWEAILR